MSEDYRINHYYAIEGDGEIEEGHIFCTPYEAVIIRTYVMNRLPEGVSITVEGGGEYDYTTEESDPITIARSIWSQSGFNTEDKE